MSFEVRAPLLLSIGAAVLTCGLKTTAWALTGSVGLLSDALESLINLTAAAMAYLALWYASRPVDATHTYGHEKVEFFSSGLEGGLILVAALGIAWQAIERLLFPRELTTLGLGLTLSLVAAVVNGIVAVILLRAARKHRSIVLEADGKHLLTDVWTSIAVLIGLGLVWATGALWLDPIVALLVAANILWTGGELMWRSFEGLMDRSLPPEELDQLRQAIRSCLGPNMEFHALRTRKAGSRRFVDFHLLVPGSMTVLESHAVADRIEDAIMATLENIEITVHVEPIESLRAWTDSVLVPLEQAERLRRGEEPMQGRPDPSPPETVP
ncbi:MAG: cation diffusion facilitator family transporter [Gemmataceae bacterium]